MTEFVVRVPPDTPEWVGVYLSGDTESLGRWAADAVPLARHRDGTFRVKLRKPGAGRFLVTRGHWRWAEVAADGSERSPRTLEANARMVECVVERWCRPAVQYHPDFRSEHLPHARPISVWLPPGYEADRFRRYPVFYLHDGQNLFDRETAFAGNPWGADEVADRLVRAGDVQPFILVGVGNSPDRLDEYGPRRGNKVGPDLSAAYAAFLTDELKPFIDGTYRTLGNPSDTAVGGSSMGGLISLHLASWRPDVFGKCAAISPSLWWDREFFLRGMRYNTHWAGRVKVWLDIGTRDGHTPEGMAAAVRRARQLAGLLQRSGRTPGKDFRYLEVEDGGHSESDWGRRFDQVLAFLFPPA